MGGKRPGAGRKKGVPNKKTQEVLEKIAESGLTPLEYMLQVMRDEGEDSHRRLSAAQAAAPYVHAKLSSIEVSGKDGNAIQVEQVRRVIVDPKNG